MIYREIKNEPVPALGFGTWELQSKAAYDAVADALAIGYRHIDTAQGYENETEVGQAIAESGIGREQLFLTTKIWFEKLSGPDVVSSTEESLRKLQTDYVDLLLIHWPTSDFVLHETLDTLFQLQKEGKVKHVGVSNFTPKLLKAALGMGEIFCNQVEYHPYLAQQRLHDLCRERKLLLTAYCPLAKGRTVNDPVLARIGKKHGKTAAQVALRWLVQQSHVAAIPRSANHEHRVQNFNIFDFSLDSREMHEIHGLARGERLINPPIAPAWGEE